MEPPLYDRLDGQVALVTGASRGLGQGIAGALAELGATVFAGIRDAGGKKEPPGTKALELDVTRDESVAAASTRLKEDSGRLDVLVNNAGTVAGPGSTLIDQPMDEIDRVLATNLRGAILVTKTFLPLLVENRGSRVVNISSGMGNLEGMNGGAPAYRISKTGLNGLTTYLHGEFHGSHGLVSNVACPGWVRTDMGGPNADRDIAKGIETPVWLCRFKPDAPSGHWWRDKEVIPW